jgi:hypothetical protein
MAMAVIPQWQRGTANFPRRMFPAFPAGRLRLSPWGEVSAWGKNRPRTNPAVAGGGEGAHLLPKWYWVLPPLDETVER